MLFFNHIKHMIEYSLQINLNCQLQRTQTFCYILCLVIFIFDIMVNCNKKKRCFPLLPFFLFP